MPQIKSQIKRMKTSEADRQRNKAVKSEIHTHLRSFETAAKSGEKDSAQESYHNAVKSVDRAASKKIIHKNKAANIKSNITKKLNALT